VTARLTVSMRLSRNELAAAKMRTAASVGRATNLRMPATIMSTPASAVSRNSASGRSAAVSGPTADPAASAAVVVVVVVITISRVLDASPPPIGPAMLAYRPYTGFTPTSTAEAMPSGTLPIAPGTPVTASRHKVSRSGRTDLNQSEAAVSRTAADSTRTGSTASAASRSARLALARKSRRPVVRKAPCYPELPITDDP
jgi:hypothetical protein